MYKSDRFQPTKQLAGEWVRYCVHPVNKPNNIYAGTDFIVDTGWQVCVINRDRGTNVVITSPVCQH